MKKIILGILIGILLLSVPVFTSANYCERCCYLYDVVKYYRVSYFDANHDWVTESVTAWTSEEAADKLGLEAGKNCFVGYNGTDFEPILRRYKVSYFNDEHEWVSETVEAESREDAVSMVNPSGGYLVGKV